LIKEELIQELKELFTTCSAKENIELIDLISRYEGDKLVLTILADKPQGNGLASFGQSHRPQGGITLGECALLNRQLSNLLEEKNIIEGDYVLEVSSPGLDRNLKAQKDFLRCLNKEVVFFLNDLVEGKCQWQGKVNKTTEDSVFIEEAGKTLEIPLVKINKARLVI
jgi:ribosome maturation factor RimP